MSGNVITIPMQYGGTPFREVPSGLQDGVNTVLTLAHTPLPDTEHFFINGQLQVPGVDYTIAGNKITTSFPLKAPGAGGYNLWCTYLY